MFEHQLMKETKQSKICMYPKTELVYGPCSGPFPPSLPTAVEDSLSLWPGLVCFALLWLVFVHLFFLLCFWKTGSQSIAKADLADDIVLFLQLPTGVGFKSATMPDVLASLGPWITVLHALDLLSADIRFTVSCVHQETNSARLSDLLQVTQQGQSQDLIPSLSDSQRHGSVPNVALYPIDTFFPLIGRVRRLIPRG